jgi:hypothetical protein
MSIRRKLNKRIYLGKRFYDCKRILSVLVGSEAAVQYNITNGDLRHIADAQEFSMSGKNRPEGVIQELKEDFSARTPYSAKCSGDSGLDTRVNG